MSKYSWFTDAHLSYLNSQDFRERMLNICLTGLPHIMRDNMSPMGMSFYGRFRYFCFPLNPLEYQEFIEFLHKCDGRCTILFSFYISSQNDIELLLINEDQCAKLDLGYHMVSKDIRHIYYTNAHIASQDDIISERINMLGTDTITGIILFNEKLFPGG